MNNTAKSLENSVKSLDNIKQYPGGRFIFYGVSAIFAVLSFFIFLFGKK